MSSKEFSLEIMGQRITRRRRILQLTQEQLAEKADLSPQFVSYAESGKRAIRPEKLLKLSTALGVSADYLLTGETSQKDGALLSEKLGKLSAPQFKAVESIIDEYIALNQRMRTDTKGAKEGKEKAEKTSSARKRKKKRGASDVSPKDA